MNAILLVFCVCCAAVSGFFGCASARPGQPGKADDVVALTSFWKPYLLYVRANPYPRLYVEVDAVEGMAPDDECLGRLRGFLAAYCAKPGGIHIVRDTVIPRLQARSIAPEALARHYMAGAHHDSNAPPTAFMYVLFFDAAWSREPDADFRQNAATIGSPRAKAERIDPQATLLPYPAAIFADPLFNGLFRKTSPSSSLVFAPVLQHEAGHLLGLGRNPAHGAAGAHCRKESCVMHPWHDFIRLLAQGAPANTPNSGDAPTLLRPCADCEADWQDLARQPAPSNLRYVGPVLVRSEPGYHVLALPSRIELIVGDFDERDAWEFLRAVQSEELKPLAPNLFGSAGIVKPEARQDRARLREMLKRARQDPYAAVRMAAARLR